MWNADRAVAELQRRGELVQGMDGLVLLRGDALRLFRALESALRVLVFDTDVEEWSVPPALPLGTLERADYFASFPQWLTVAAHVGDDEAQLARLAAAARPAAVLDEAVAPPAAALQPALCYHVYQALAGTTCHVAVRVTCTGTCWRHERDRHSPLERGWAFTMRELVCVAPDADVVRFLAGQRAAAVGLAHRLGLEPAIEPATDPFFAPSGRGRAALQRIRGLKDELLLPLGDGRTTAAASFNHHERFFGEAFDIRLPDGAPAVTGCSAFGVERWVLAALVAWGPDARAWPTHCGGMAAGRAPVHMAVQA